LQPILEELKLFEDGHLVCTVPATDYVNRLYDNVVEVLRFTADLFIPRCKRNFYKFWWDSELELLKDNAVKSCRIWKEAGKPKNESIL